MATRSFRAPRLDRLITVMLLTSGRNDFGEPFETVVEHSAWAALRDLSAGEDLERSGNRDFAERIWRIRWTATIANADTTNAEVRDDAGVVWGVNRIVEVTGRDGEIRNRYLDIEASAETS